MKYTIHLRGNAVRMIDDKLIQEKDVLGYMVSDDLLFFWMGEQQEQQGFYKLEDIDYVLPKE